MPLQFFTNDFGIKRGGSNPSFEDEDVPQNNEPEQNFLGFNQPGPGLQLSYIEHLHLDRCNDDGITRLDAQQLN